MLNSKDVKKDTKFSDRSWTKDDIDELAKITPADIKAAREFATPELHKLLDATPQTSVNNSGKQ